jgi:hypothetical protein
MVMIYEGIEIDTSKVKNIWIYIEKCGSTC